MQQDGVCFVCVLCKVHIVLQLLADVGEVGNLVGGRFRLFSVTPVAGLGFGSCRVVPGMMGGSRTRPRDNIPSWSEPVRV